MALATRCGSADQNEQGGSRRANVIPVGRVCHRQVMQLRDHGPSQLMRTMMTLPVIGAALTNSDLAVYRDWILEKDRDLELQSFVNASVLDADWAPLAAQVRAVLDGYKGRMGIHGPFWGFTIDTPDPLVREVVQKRLNQGLDVCAAVGASHMVLHSPFTTWDYNNLDGQPGDREDLISRTHTLLRPIVTRAETLGVTLVMENIEDIKADLARGLG